MSLLKKNGVLAKRNSKLQEVITTPGDCGCCGGGEPCVDCWGSGHPQGDMLMTGLPPTGSGGCSQYGPSETIPYSSFGGTADYCQWVWAKSVSGSDVTITLRYNKSAVNQTIFTCTYPPGTFGVLLQISPCCPGGGITNCSAPVTFSCNQTSGLLSGSAMVTAMSGCFTSGSATVTISL